MRVAAIYDIHGNLPALEAVLSEINNERVEMIVVGGDVIVGPMSRECLDLLLKSNTQIHFILGNCESAVIQKMTGESELELPEMALKDVEWTSRQLNSKHLNIISSWRETLSFELEGLGKILFCHGTPHSNNEIFTKHTSIEKLIPIFGPTNADVIICGHTHMQFIRDVQNIKVANAGSVGMPFGNPGAFWIMLDEKIALRKTEYDFEDAAKRVLNTSYPNSKSFAEENILNPPSENMMLNVFAEAELN